VDGRHLGRERFDRYSAGNVCDTRRVRRRTKGDDLDKGVNGESKKRDLEEAAAVSRRPAKPTVRCPHDQQNADQQIEQRDDRLMDRTIEHRRDDDRQANEEKGCFA